MSRAIRTSALLGAAAGVLLMATPAVASKYIGPKSAVVRCKVLRVLAPDDPALAAGSESPNVKWALNPAAGEIVAEVAVLAIEKYDNNGWESEPAHYIPKQLLITMPKKTARKGRVGRASLSFSPGYGRKLVITYTYIEARWMAEQGPPSSMPE
jgi:hypothetical protein